MDTEINDSRFREFLRKLIQMNPDERIAFLKNHNEEVEKTAMEDLIKKLSLPPLESGYTYRMNSRYLDDRTSDYDCSGYPTGYPKPSFVVEGPKDIGGSIWSKK